MLPGFDEQAFNALTPAERKEVEKELKALLALRDSNPLEFFHPYPQQEQFLASRVKHTAFFAGNRAGKTTVAMVKVILQAIERRRVPEHLQRFKTHDGPFFCWVACPGEKQLETVILQKIREWMPKDQLRGGDFDKAYSRSLQILHLANGGWIGFKTYGQDPFLYAGSALHMVLFDEEPPEEIFEECKMRVIDYDGQLAFSMTPTEGLSWMYDKVWERRHEDLFEVIVADMDDNPHLPEAAKQAALDGLTEEQKQARKEGRFVHFAGMVFPEFRDQLHVCAPPMPGTVQQQSVVVGIDPGIRWTGVSFTAFDDENCALTFDELYLEQHTVDRLVAAIQERNRYWGIEPSFYVIDPSARNRTQINADSTEAELQRHGIYCVHGQNDRENGINTMKQRLQGATWLISTACPRLLWELQRYKYDPRAENKFEVVKKDDHVLDSVRYALMSRAWGVVRQPERNHRKRGGYNPGFAEAWP